VLLSPKRLRERAGIFAAPLGVVGLVCGVTIGVLGLISAAATDGVRIGLAERSGTDIAYRQGPRPGRAPGPPLGLLAPAHHPGDARPRHPHRDRRPRTCQPSPPVTDPLSLNEIRRLLAKLAINAVHTLDH
jgi:hypothetical protein